jgi:hypothetical protein
MTGVSPNTLTMKTKQKNKEKVESVHLTFQPRLNPQTLRAEFLKTVPKKEDTEIDDVLQKFLYAMEYLTSSGRGSFTEQDVLIAVKQFDIPAQEVQRLFKLWSEKMEFWSVVSIVDGAYDEKIYVLH